VEWTLADNRVVYRQEASAPAHPGVFEGPSAR